MATHSNIAWKIPWTEEPGRLQFMGITELDTIEHTYTHTHTHTHTQDFFGRNDAKAETLVLWPPRAKSCLIGKDSDAKRDWGQEEKGTTEDEMAGWHH